MANKELNGYKWSDVVLIHSIIEKDNYPVDRIVLPTTRRCQALKLAHDKTAHVGVRGMRKRIGRRFTWPGLHSDIVAFIKSCDKCLRFNNPGNKKVKMVERGIVTVPFETVAVDLVGPLPKGRRGVKYLFTYICLASRWPEAQPMRTASATEASQCFLDIISRTGIPLKVLSDRGSVFLSKLMNGLYERLGIDPVATSPYRPQSNGVVERFHGTLKPMLAKARDSDVDWADFLPLTLFAIRQVPNRTTGFSSHQLVYGRDVIGPLANFCKLKDSLCNHVVLTIPGPEDELVLYTDASGDGIGGCLHVIRSDGEKPVAFFSRQLRPAEKNYSVTELESLAIVASIHHFEYHVYGHPLKIVTDHRACLAISNGSHLNRRLLRFALALQDMEVEIVHRPGSAHGNADGLSRQSWDQDESATPGLSAVTPGLGMEGGDVGVATRRKKEKK